MEHAISEIIKIFTTMLLILLLVGMVIMGKHISDVNSFKEYVNTQIERNGGYTETVKTNVEKMNEDSYNNLFFVYEPNSNTKKKIEPAYFGDVVKYEIHADIPIPFTTSGNIEIPIAFKGQAVSRIRNINTPEPSNKINPDDAKWVTKGDWGSNGKFVVDKDGNAVIYAIDASKPIIFHDMDNENAKLPRDTLTSLTFQDKVQGDTNSSMSYAFMDRYPKLKTINNLDTNVDTSNVKYMVQMFAGSKLTTVGDLSKWNTSNVTDMSYMFEASQLTSVGDLSQWNTSNVTNMFHMFYGSKLTSVGDLSHWNTSKVTYMGDMFYGSQLTPPSWYRWDAGPEMHFAI